MHPREGKSHQLWNKSHQRDKNVEKNDENQCGLGWAYARRTNFFKARVRSHTHRFWRRRHWGPPCPKSTVGGGLRPPPTVYFQCILFKIYAYASVRVLWDHFEKVGATCVGSAKATFPWFVSTFSVRWCDLPSWEYGFSMSNSKKNVALQWF